jgi:hypothetical protein
MTGPYKMSPRMQAVAPSGTEMSAYWIRNSVEGNDSSLVQCIIPAFAWEDWDEWWRTAFRVVDLQAEVYHGPPEDCRNAKQLIAKFGFNGYSAIYCCCYCYYYCWYWCADWCAYCATCVLTADTDILIPVTGILNCCWYWYSDLYYSCTNCCCLYTYCVNW